MKFFKYSVFLIFCLALVPSCSKDHIETDPMYQVNSFAIFGQGDYDGFYSYSDILKKGDFGLGTFDALNGEMVMLDGKVFRIEAAGNPIRVDGSETAPLATFCKFDCDLSFEAADLSLDELKKEIDSRLPDENLFYAIRIEGQYKQITTRSIYAQSKPYRILTDVLKEEVRLESENVEGTAVGFRSPEHMEKALWKSYHMHFISKDETIGGHIHEAQLGDVVVKIDILDELNLILKSK